MLNNLSDNACVVCDEEFIVGKIGMGTLFCVFCVLHVSESKSSWICVDVYSHTLPFSNIH